MGFYTIFGACYSCGKMFSFHPHKVPSLSVKGERQPICKDCIDRVNPIRKEKGLPPITYSEDAYGDAAILEEGEL